jgi:hypothetical protein
MNKQHLFNSGRIHSGYKVWRTANIIALLLLLAATAFGQNVQRDVSGNFTAMSKVKASHDSTTTYTFTDSKGTVHPVYKGGKGAFYVVKVSKSGNFYRYYLKTEQ